MAIHAVLEFSDDSVVIHSADTKYAGKYFRPGFYSAWFDNHGSLKIQIETLKEFHTPWNTESNNIILKVVQSFFQDGIKKKINDLGFIHKLGVLLYGIQGSGKTALLHYISNQLKEEREAIVMFCNTEKTLVGAMALARQIRDIQDNPIIFIADEFDRYSSSAESECKNFLDGNESLDNMLFLASTNYIDKIPKTIKERPSRFKIVQEISGITDKNLMKSMLRDISNRIEPGLFTEEEIENRVEGIVSATIDDIKHICLDKAANSYLPKKTSAAIGFRNQKEKEDEEVFKFDGFTFISEAKEEPKKADSNI